MHSKTPPPRSSNAQRFRELVHQAGASIYEGRISLHEIRTRLAKVSGVRSRCYTSDPDDRHGWPKLFAQGSHSNR